MCGIEKGHIYGCLGIILFSSIFSILVCLGIEKIIDDYSNDNNIIENNKVDSITKVNKTLIIEINHLDSIKNEKVIKVKSLDNDSTVKLFYKLIRE